MDTLLKDTKPQYILSVETARGNNPGHWKFVLKDAEGIIRFQAADVEPDVFGERLDLLTIIRALEALDQPSRVTLTSSSTYIRQGMQYGLAEWRASHWQWEFFGYMVPVKHADLWQRMDHLLNVHSVECRQRRFDAPHYSLAGPKSRQLRQPTNWGFRVAADIWLKYAARIMPDTIRQRIHLALQNIRQRYMHLRPAS